jgi:hypothetical protein
LRCTAGKDRAALVGVEARDVVGNVRLLHEREQRRDTELGEAFDRDCTRSTKSRQARACADCALVGMRTARLEPGSLNRHPVADNEGGAGACPLDAPVSSQRAVVSTEGLIYQDDIKEAVRIR